MFDFFKKKSPPGRSNLDLRGWKQRGDMQGKSFDQILTMMRSADNTMPSGFFVDITERLLEIYFEDDTQTDEARSEVLRVTGIVIDATEKAFDDNPHALEAYRKAYTSQIENGKRFGIGSLAHKITKLSGEDIIAEIVKPSNAHLLADFPRDIVDESRLHCIRALLLDRTPLRINEEPSGNPFLRFGGGNVVNTASWLVLIRDPTALYLFNDVEKQAFQNYYLDYERARDCLADAGVLSPGRILGFTPIPDPAMIRQFMLQSSIEENTADVDPTRGDEREHLTNLDRTAREGFNGIVIAYRLWVWQCALRSIYGQRFLDEVNAIQNDTEASRMTMALTEHISRLYGIVKNQEKPLPFDQAILADLMHEYLDRTLPERHLDGAVQSCTTVLRSEMFHFPPYVRYLIRYLVHGADRANDALREDRLR